jgi:hypothetical protein
MGEVLSGATPPLDLILPWNLALMAGLYGCGALICREVARRNRLGLLGLALLGAAYGVYEEGFVDRFWFDESYWDDSGVGDYGVLWGTNLMLAVNLTAFHTAISICSSVIVVEHLFPGRQGREWVGHRGLLVAGVALFVLVPVALAESAPWPGAGQLVLVGALFASLVAAAFAAPSLRRPPPPRRASGRIATIAFLATTGHFLLIYALPSSGLPWPASIALALVPIALGYAAIRRRASGGPYGADALRVVTGMVWFFVVLDALVGLGGRLDMTLGAIAVALALRWLNGHAPQPGRPCGASPTL